MLTTQRLRRSTVLKCLIFGCLALALGASSAVAQETTLKIGVVNLDYIVANSPAGKSLQAKLEAFQQEAAGQVEAMTSDMQALRQRIADGVNSLSDDKLAEMQKEFEDKGIALRRLRDDKQREGQKMQNEGLQEIETQLEPVFTAVRDEGGYDLILNNVPGVVVMIGPSVDITQKVLDKMGGGS